MAITPCTWAIPRVPRTSQQLEHFTSGPSSTTAFFGGGPQHRTFCNPPLRRVLLCFFASLLLCFFASLLPYLLAPSFTNSKILSSAQNRSAPLHLDMNPQCPPCSGAINSTRGFSATRARKNA